MVMRLGIGDRKPDGDDVEERRLGCIVAGFGASKIVADVKDRLENVPTRAAAALIKGASVRPSAFVSARKSERREPSWPMANEVRFRPLLAGPPRAHDIENMGG